MPTKLPPGTFFGRTQTRIEVAGLTFAESVYAAESELFIPIHSHENTSIYFVTEGICDPIHGGKSTTSSPTTVAFQPAGEPHSIRWHGAGGRVFHIDISRARAEAIRDRAPVLDGPAEFCGGAAPWLARRLFREFRRLDDISALAMEGLALEILAEASRPRVHASERTPPRWLLLARELLHDRFAQSMSLDEISMEVGIHPVHLTRAFRRQYGCTPGDYLRKLRVEFACGRLVTSDTPLSEVALAAGFSDQSHFTKAFRRRMLMTPGEFRRHFRSR
jgi:AraC family transcriptional regulator